MSDARRSPTSSTPCSPPARPSTPTRCSAAPGLSLIAEVKRSSPSKGALSDIPDPAALAAAYEAGRRQRSRCSPSSAASAAASTTSTPCAPRSPSRCCARTSSSPTTRCGRPAPTAPTSCCSSSRRSTDPELAALLGRVRELGMTALVEVHDEVETQRAVDAGARVIGVNARNLKTLEVDPETFSRLRPLIPDGCVTVAESGIADARDAAAYADAGRRRRARRRGARAHGRPARRRGVDGRGRRTPTRHPARTFVPDPTTATADATDLVPEELARPGRFGPFGGRYVPEALIPALEQLDEARQKAAVDPEFHRRARPAAPHLHRPAEHHHRGAALRRALRRGARHPQARGPQPHRLAQDQQRARPGAAHQADGQDPGHRRDRRRPARRRHGHRGRPDRPRLHRLHGRGRHRAPGAQRRPDAASSAPRSSRSSTAAPRSRTPSTRRCATGSPTSPTTHYLIGTVTGPHPFPEMVRDFHKIIGEEARGAGARAHRPAARTPSSRASAAARTPWASSTASSPDAGVRLVGIEAGGEGIESGRHAARFARPASPGVLHGAMSYLMQDDDGQTVESHSISAGLDYPSVGPGARLAARQRPRRVPLRHRRPRPWRRSACCAAPRGSSRPSSRRTPWSGAMEVGQRARPGRPAAGQPLRPWRQGRGDRRDVVRPARRGASRRDRTTVRRAPRSVLRRCRDGGPRRPRRLPAGRASPTVEGSIEAMRVLVEAGCDVVEVGVPYSDPLMDGPVIQHAAADGAGRRHPRRRRLPRDGGGRARPAAPPLVMTYWNLVLRRGVERFAADLAAAGGAGLITPDLIPDEAGDWIAASDAHGLDRVFLVAPVVDPRAARQGHPAPAAGFVYAASTMGVTGARTSVDGDAARPRRAHPGGHRPAGLRRARGVDRGAGRRAGGLRRRRHRRLRPGAHAERPRGTRRPARRVAGTDDRAGRRSEDEAMSTEMDGATGATPVDVDEEPSAGRERVLDVVGLVARLFLGVVLVFAGIVKVGRPAHRRACGAGLRDLPDRGRQWIGLAPALRRDRPRACCSLLGLFTRAGRDRLHPAHGGLHHRHLAGLGARPDHRLRLLRRRRADRRRTRPSTRRRSPATPSSPSPGRGCGGARAASRRSTAILFGH